MKFESTDIPGVTLIHGEPFRDDRGVFRRHFCEKELYSAGLDSCVKQSNLSENYKKGTLRGFHYQTGEHAESKTMSAIVGSFYDIVVDLRPDSPTYLKWQGFTIKASERTAIHIPRGCANSFLTLEDNTVIHYYCSNFYQPDAERGVRYNDPLFNFKWPLKPASISTKDLSHPDFTP